MSNRVVIVAILALALFAVLIWNARAPCDCVCDPVDDAAEPLPAPRLRSAFWFPALPYPMHVQRRGA